MRAWLSRNKRYIIAVFVLVQIILIGSYISERVDLEDIQTNILSPQHLPQKVQYMLIQSEDADFDTLNEAPHYLKQYYDLVFGRLLYRKSGVYVPDVARSWSLMKKQGDKDVWNMQLREGLTFHDGRALDFEDIVHSFELAKETVPALKKTELQQIDDTSLEIITSDPSLLASLSSFYIVPKDWTKGSFNGSGPYTVVGDQAIHDSIHEVTLAPNTSYFQEVPEETKKVLIFDSRYRFIARAVNLLLSEERLLALNVPEEYGATFRQYCTVDEAYELQPYILLKNQSSARISTLVDRALTYTFSKRSNELLAPLAGATALTQYTSPGLQGHEEALNMYASVQEPEVTSASLQLTVYTEYQNVPFIAHLGSMLQKYNIALSIIPGTQDEVYDALSERRGDLYLIRYNYRPSPTLLSFLDDVFENGMLFTGFADSSILEAMQRARGATSVIMRQEVLKSIARKLDFQLGYPLFDTVYFDARCNM